MFNSTQLNWDGYDNYIVISVFGERLGERRRYDHSEISPVRMRRRWWRWWLRRMPRWIAAFICATSADSERRRRSWTRRTTQWRRWRRIAVTHFQHSARRIHCNIRNQRVLNESSSFLPPLKNSHNSIGRAMPIFRSFYLKLTWIRFRRRWTRRNAGVCHLRTRSKESFAITVDWYGYW